jgi:hypothetical protein
VEIAKDAITAANERARFALHEDAERVPVALEHRRDHPARFEVVLGRLDGEEVARRVDRVDSSVGTPRSGVGRLAT